MWGVYVFIEHDDFVELPNGSRFKRVTKQLVQAYRTMEEALANPVHPICLITEIENG